jgi:hypothetical protein
MLSAISWSQFLTTIAWAILIYYLVVAILFYRKEIFSLFKTASSGPFAFSFGRENHERTLSYNEMTAATGKEDPYQDGELHDLLEDIKSLLSTAVKAKTVREELVMALQLLLRDYPVFKNLPLREEINQHILTECKVICSITLSEAEMKMLWNG